MMRRVRSDRRGFTLIEFLAVVGVVLVLCGLLLPAVQSARETARRAACQSNLRQIGIALAGYHELNGCFPLDASVGEIVVEGELRNIYFGAYSIHTRLLPFLDQQPLFESINMEESTYPPDTFAFLPLRPDELAANAVNSTAYNTSIALFVCPTDSADMPPGANSYRGNGGVGPWRVSSGGFPDSANGLFTELRVTRVAQVTDGLSHTAAFSERIVGTMGEPKNASPRRDYWAAHTHATNADQMMRLCYLMGRTSNDQRFTTPGRWWFWSGKERTTYYHAQPPNGRIVDCTWPAMRTTLGMVTARSDHPGGVNTLMGDGSVRFVADAVGIAVWRAMGSRNGKEVVP